MRNNSFTENVNRIIKNSNDTINILNAINESTVSDSDSVKLKLKDSEGNNNIIELPSYNSIINKVNSLGLAVNNFMNGMGVVELEDGTKRVIKPTSLPKGPEQITDLLQPSTFKTNSNWFLEDLMFPKIEVPINLTGKVDVRTNRALVKRVILDFKNEKAYKIYKDYIEGKNLTPTELDKLLTENEITYIIDEDEVKLPLSIEMYTGDFRVVDTDIINGNVWLELDSIMYKTVMPSGANGGDKILSINDRVSYNDILFNVTDINTSTRSVRLTPLIGYAQPGIESVLSIYNEPYKSKFINIGVCNDEINIVYIKSIDDYYNLVATKWSEPITYITNDLVLGDNKNLTLGEYYLTNVKDFGKIFLSEAKEGKVNSYNALIPNVPVLASDYFSVVQINTQLNAVLDNDDIKNTASNIETIKSKITSLKETISSQKSDLQSTKDLQHHNNIQSQINSNTTQLNQLQTEYSSSLKYLQNLISGGGLVKADPKFRIRGFFPIPKPRYIDELNQLGKQQIIGFEIAYRYLKLDSTGTNLNTFKYKIDGVEYSGVFSDWNIEQSPILQKVYNRDTGNFVWQNESIGDGNIVNINQLDISIRKGEKVEVKIRSISEAGWPDNAQKSNWSDSIIIEFPDNLDTKSEIDNLIENINNESVNLSVNEALTALGMYNHVSDSIPNPTSVSGNLFKHTSNNIGYDYYVDGKVYSIPLNDIINVLVETFENSPEDVKKAFVNAKKQNIKLK